MEHFRYCLGKLRPAMIGGLFLLGAATFLDSSATPADSEARRVLPVTVRVSPLSDWRRAGECVAEAYAYYWILALSRELTKGRDIFDDALDDLRDQLSDLPQ